MPLDRRSFLAACAACAACPMATWAAADKSDDDAEAREPVEVGKLADYPRDAAYDKYAEDHGFFLVREKGRLFAPSSTCTHRESTLKLKGPAFACPKHGARFTLQGVVTKPPAKRPLPRYAIRLGDDGEIIVDPSKTFGKGEWDKPGSFIPLK